MTSREKALKTYSLYEQARTKAGLSDYAVSQQTKIAPMCICDWKHGRSTPKLDKLYRISKLLGIPFEMFVEV